MSRYYLSFFESLCKGPSPGAGALLTEIPLIVSHIADWILYQLWQRHHRTAQPVLWTANSIGNPVPFLVDTIERAFDVLALATLCLFPPRDELYEPRLGFD